MHRMWRDCISSLRDDNKSKSLQNFRKMLLLRRLRSEANKTKLELELFMFGKYDKIIITTLPMNENYCLLLILAERHRRLSKYIY
jgi:hypothetical protein